MNPRAFGLQIVIGVVISVAAILISDVLRERQASTPLPQGPARGYGQV